MKKFAVFDIDGTLVRWQLYHAVVDQLGKQGQLDKAAHQQLRQARMRWKRRESPEAFKAYEHDLIKTFEAALPQLQPKAFDQAVQAVINEYADQVYTYSRDLIQDLKGQGYFLLAISGSHQELVQHIAQHFSFDDSLGSVYERDGGRFSGKSSIPSLNKQAALEQLVSKHQLGYQGSWAIGDSQSDAAMLQMVDHPIAFNPEKALFETAQKQGWPIVVERKNVVYKLEPQSGRYLLA